MRIHPFAANDNGKMAELATLIYRCLLHFECLHQFSNFASLSVLHYSHRLWALLHSPLYFDLLFGFLNTLSSPQKTLLVARVTLSFLTNLSAFVEVDTYSPVPPSVTGLLTTIKHWEEAAPDLDLDVDVDLDLDLDCNYWRDRDAALLLLIICEAREQQCLEAVEKWQVDPLLYSRFVNADEMKTSLVRKYLCENIVNMCYNVPGLTVDAGLRSFVDLVCRYHTLLTTLFFISHHNSSLIPASASAATILSLPSPQYSGSGSGSGSGSASSCQGKQCECTVCGDPIEMQMDISSLPCSHVYHRDCITAWLKTRNTCPVCRHQLPTDDVFCELARHIKCLMSFAGS